MATQADPKSIALALASFLAGAGLGVGTTITVTTPDDPDAGPGWTCTVLSNRDVFCEPVLEVIGCACPDGGAPSDAVP